MQEAVFYVIILVHPAGVGGVAQRDSHPFHILTSKKCSWATVSLSRKLFHTIVYYNQTEILGELVTEINHDGFGKNKYPTPKTLGIQVYIHVYNLLKVVFTHKLIVLY